MESKVVIRENNSFLMAMGKGSRLEIHAADKKKASWLQLANGYTASPNDTEITLDNEGKKTHWEIGDQFAIATSYYHERRTEVRRIQSIVDSGRLTKITFKKPLNYTHYGEIETYRMVKKEGEELTWDIDMRAEVGLLTRNIVIQGHPDRRKDEFGGHVMVMMGGKMHIAGAELKFMGQDGFLGRYPLHWHLSGDVKGQYITNNSIHNSFHKGITLHGTQNAWVENNVVFETQGHGIFLEDGTEENNVIKKNLVFNTKKAKTPVIASDKFAISSYWSNNPNNHFIGNHAAGSRGSGFWIAGNRKPIAGAEKMPQYKSLVPRQRPFGLFQGNTAHSNLKTSSGTLGREMTGIGLNIGQEIQEDKIKKLDHDNYAELHQPVLGQSNDIYNLYVSDFTSYMNEDVGIFARTFGGHLKNIKLADNGLAIMTTGGQLIEESVVIGHSKNSNIHKRKFETIRESRYGLGLYTDSVVVDKTLYANFKPEWTNSEGQKIRDSILTQRTGANNSTLHVMQDIQIKNTHPKNYFMSNGKNGNRRSDELSVASVGFVDGGGAFTGIPGAMVTARLRPAEEGIEDQSSRSDVELLTNGFQRAPYIDLKDSILQREEELDAHINKHQIAGHFKLQKGHSGSFKTITRSDGEMIRTDLVGNGTTSDQLVVFAYKDSSYGLENKVYYTFEWDNQIENDLEFIIRDFAKGQQVYFILKKVPRSTTIQGSDPASSLDELIERSPLKGSSHFFNGSDLHLLLSATDESYHPQLNDLATINHRVFWDGVRIRPNGTGRDKLEGDHQISHKMFRPFTRELEKDFGDQVSWRKNPIKFVQSKISEKEMLEQVEKLDPAHSGSTSETISKTQSFPLWSDPNSWAGKIPASDSIVIIRNGEKVTLDKNTRVQGIIIEGSGSVLNIMDQKGARLKLTSDFVLVLNGGLFQAGTETNLLDTDFTLELSGEDPEFILPVTDLLKGQTNHKISYIGSEKKPILQSKI